MTDITAIRARDREAPTEEMRPLVAALRPLSVRCADAEGFSMTGTVAAARQAQLLAGRGLPGDPGCNKTCYRFRTQEGLRLLVRRSQGVDSVWVIVRESIEKERSRQAARMAARRAEEEALDESYAAAIAAQEGPEAYRAFLCSILTMLSSSARANGLPTARARWRMPAAVHAQVAGHLEQLRSLIEATPLLPVAELGRPAFTLVCGGAGGLAQSISADS